jgi:hypothetical protein
MNWHLFMQFPSSCEPHNASPDIRRIIKQEQDSRKFERWRQMRDMDVEGHSQELSNQASPTSYFLCVACLHKTRNVTLITMSLLSASNQ